jgi:tetratricopeptide (TPR) repeat protein
MSAATALTDRNLAGCEFDYVPAAERLTRGGLEMLARGDLRGALSAFRAATRDDADFEEAWYHSAVVLAQLGRHAEAVFDFDRALSLNPDRAEALVNRGRSLQALGDFEGALADFDRAMDCAPPAIQASVLPDRTALQQACGDLVAALAG